MTDTQFTIIVTAIATGIPALVVAVASLVTAIRTSRKADDIIIATNGTMTSMRGELAVAMEKIGGLEKLVAAQLVSSDLRKHGSTATQPLPLK